MTLGWRTMADTDPEDIILAYEYAFSGEGRVAYNDMVAAFHDRDSVELEDQMQVDYPDPAQRALVEKGQRDVIRRIKYSLELAAEVRNGRNSREP